MCSAKCQGRIQVGVRKTTLVTVMGQIAAEQEWRAGDCVGGQHPHPGDRKLGPRRECLGKKREDHCGEGLDSAPGQGVGQ